MTRCASSNPCPCATIDGHSHGEIVSRVIVDVDTLADGLLLGFTQLFTGVLTILGTLGVLMLRSTRASRLVVCF